MMGERAVSQLEHVACQQKKYGEANIGASSIDHSVCHEYLLPSHCCAQQTGLSFVPNGASFFLPSLDLLS
jgi:hypothetical protein